MDRLIRYAEFFIVAVLIMSGIDWYIRKVERSSRPSLGPTHDAMVGKRLRRIGVALIAGSLAMMTITAATWSMVSSAVLSQYSVALVAPVFLSIPLITIGVFLLYRGRQHLARVDSAERLRDPRPPVVLLRAFQSD